MMKKNKLSFFAVMVAVVVGYAIYDYRSEIKQNITKQEQAILLNWNKDQIRSVKIEMQKSDSPELETAVELNKKDAEAPELPGWFLQQPLVERAKGQSVDDFVEGIVTEKSIETVVEAKEVKNLKEAQPKLVEPDWAAFGLDKPLGKITLLNNLGESVVFSIGSVKNFQGDAFLRKGDEKKVYLASSTWLKKIQSKAIDFRDKRLIQFPVSDFPLSAILSVKFKGSRGLDSNYEINKKSQKNEAQVEDLWVVAAHPNWKIDQNKIRDTISLIGSLEAIEFIAESKPTMVEMKSWGFDHPALDLTVTMKDSLKGQKDWHGIFAVGKDQIYRCWLEDRGKLVKVSPADMQKLLVLNADSFRDRHEPFELDSSKVKTVELQLLGANGKSENLASTEELAQKWIAHVKSLNLAKFTELTDIKKKNGQLSFKDDKGEMLLQLNWESAQNGFYNVKSSKFAAVVQVAEADMTIFHADSTNSKNSLKDKSEVHSENEAGKVKK